MEIKTTPLAAMQELVSRIKYKPGWEFLAQEKLEFNHISVGVCLTTIEQDPAQRIEQERERERWIEQERERERWLRGLSQPDYYEWGSSRYEPVTRSEPRTRVWREYPFSIPAIPDLTEEMVVSKIWEMVVLIEAHEIKEFFRVDGLCVQEPHPESPRELAFGGALDRWDFMGDLLGGRRFGGFDTED